MAHERRIPFHGFLQTCVSHQSFGLWASPGDQSVKYKDLDYWVNTAKLLEKGKLDGLFIADVHGVYETYAGSPDAAIRRGMQFPCNDPLMQISAMASATEKLHFGATVSVAYEQPYGLARRLSTLDHLTDGRIAWNVVTSYLDSAARNFGSARQMAHDERYSFADEFLEVCYKLWEGSWEDDAVLADRAGQVYTDPSKVHGIEHDGKYFCVPGVHMSEPSPQRTPVIWQAGASPAGRAFAARHAEAIFTVAPSVRTLRNYVDDIRQTAAASGRDPYSVKIHTEVTIITAENDRLAEAKYQEYLQWVEVEGALAFYSGVTGIDLSALDPDKPLKYVDTESARFALDIFSKADPDRDWTPNEIAKFIGIGAMGPVMVGSPKTVADELERYVDESGVDGFILTYAAAPSGFEDFVEFIVPELQKRGRYWDDYDEGRTVRERLYGVGHRRVRDDHPAAKYGSARH